MKRMMIGVMLFTIMALALVGCGGSGSTSSASAPASSAPEASASAATEASASAATEASASAATETSASAAASAPSSGAASSAATAADGELETTTIRWNYGVSGNVLVAIAEEKGFFKDAGITIEPIAASTPSDMVQLLTSGKVDVISNAGTNFPLQTIAAGEEVTIFGGHMVTGCMPIIAKTGTVWNGPEDLIGHSFAAQPSFYAITGTLMDMGYDPLTEIDWRNYSDYNDAMAAVARGEVDYAMLGTQQNALVAQNPEIEVMAYQSDVMPNYSCCRMAATTEFVENNPNTIKAILKVLLRSQAYYEANKEECVSILANAIGAEEDFVSVYMLNEHYRVNVDPLKNSVERAWKILDETGFLDANAKNVDLDAHIETDLYEEALAEAKAEFGSEYPDFFSAQEKFYQENDK